MTKHKTEISTELELANYLKDNCYPLNNYSINGNFIHEGCGIENNGGLYQWYYTERGVKRTLKYFPTEKKAVQFALKEITKDQHSNLNIIGIYQNESEKNHIISELDKRNIKYYTDKIPLNNLENLSTRIFVYGCDILLTKDLCQNEKKQNEKEQIIYRSYSEKINPWLILLIVTIATFLIYKEENLILKLIIGLPFIIGIFYALLRSKFESTIKITNNHIEIIKNNLLRKNISYILNFDEIDIIKYNHGRYPRQDSAIYLGTNNHNIKVLIKENSFEFGHVLKFLKGKKLKIDLIHSDHELKLYIEGKITEFPMKNEKTA